jgi:transcriptional regulator with XRE-family HTH domain
MRMGRNPIKENQNPYFRARKQAAEWDARLESRERASELIGIAAYTLADYELGNVKRVPADKVLIMADLYNAPWLLSNYCKNECPICGFLPLATEEKNICSVTVRLLKALREDELENMKNQLLEISQDGKIRDDEVEAVRKISEYLDGIPLKSA